MIVIISPEARADLVEIGDAIAIDNPSRAESFICELRERALHLGELPLGFPIVPRLAHIEVRRRNHGNYAILYRVTSEQVDVLRFLHGRRDLKAIFPAT